MSEVPNQGGFEGGTHFLPVRVYYEDTDFTGVVYHGSFVRFLERGRTESLRALGIDHRVLAGRDDPLAFTVRRLNIAFLKPARIDDSLMVRTSYEEAAGARILAQQQIFRGDELLLGAEVEVACIALNGRPRRLPAELLEALRRTQAGGDERRGTSP